MITRGWRKYMIEGREMIGKNATNIFFFSVVCLSPAFCVEVSKDI